MVIFKTSPMRSVVSAWKRGVLRVRVMAVARSRHVVRDDGRGRAGRVARPEGVGLHESRCTCVLGS
jgi:hypothetical protein